MIEVVEPIKIYRTKFFGDSKKLTENVLSKTSNILSKQSIVTKGLSTFHPILNSSRKMDKWPEFADYLDFIRPHIDLYVNEIRLPVDKISIDEIGRAHV